MSKYAILFFREGFSSSFDDEALFSYETEDYRCRDCRKLPTFQNIRILKKFDHSSEKLERPYNSMVFKFEADNDDDAKNMLSSLNLLIELEGVDNLDCREFLDYDINED